ncbi:uncharacterized protein VNE69_12037 [Vairimorpha necatrix]|uniref:Uncharacterized protein n=1 Tax=Vairimorpha necatrix TaxID=6039 RepID=A0AAX4JGI5_9MICR
MPISSFDILKDINDLKDKNDNYYHLIDKLLMSSLNQQADIKYQIYYIVAKEYYHFKEFEKSYEYFLKVFNNRNLFIVYNIIEDTVLHILQLKCGSIKDVSYALYHLLITKDIDKIKKIKKPKEITIKSKKENIYDNVENKSNVIDDKDVTNDIYLEILNLKYEKSIFFSYLFEHNELDFAVHFLPDDKLDIFIDKLMLTNHYTDNIRNILVDYRNINVFLYLSVFDKKNIKDYEMKIKSFNDKYSQDSFYYKYDLKDDFYSKLDDDSIYFLYKNRKYLQLTKSLNSDDNFTNNILYFSYFKISDLKNADIFYKKAHQILFPVDEIEYLNSLNFDSFVINKVNSLDNPIDLLNSLEVLYFSKNYDVLKECVLNNIKKYKDINIFKVMISYLLIQNLEVHDVCVFIQEYIQGIDISDLDKDWLYKVVYNSIIDDMDSKKTYLDLLYQLKDPCLDTIYIALLLNTRDYSSLYDEFVSLEDTKSDLYFTVLILFYELREDKDVLNKLNISQRRDDQILSLLEISTNKNIIIEAHTRNILTPDILERAILFNSVKGKLYAFLESIYMIDPRGYLSYNSRIILKKEIDILTMYGDYKVVEFYKSLL